MLANFLSGLGAAQTNNVAALDIPFQVIQSGLSNYLELGLYKVYQLGDVEEWTELDQPMWANLVSRWGFGGQTWGISCAFIEQIPINVVHNLNLKPTISAQSTLLF